MNGFHQKVGIGFCVLHEHQQKLECRLHNQPELQWKRCNVNNQVKVTKSPTVTKTNMPLSISSWTENNVMKCYNCLADCIWYEAVHSSYDSVVLLCDAVLFIWWTVEHVVVLFHQVSSDVGYWFIKHSFYYFLWSDEWHSAIESSNESIIMKTMLTILRLTLEERREYSHWTVDRWLMTPFMPSTYSITCPRAGK